MKWQKELAQSGLAESAFSEKIKKQIAAYHSLAQELNDVEDENEIDEINSAMEMIDNNLCKEIPKYAKNKDRYDALGKKMAEARNAKKASGGTVKTATPAAQTQTATPAAQTQTATPVTPKPNAEIEEKKSGGLGTVLLAIGAIGGIALAVATFGKYNPFKK